MENLEGQKGGKKIRKTWGKTGSKNSKNTYQMMIGGLEGCGTSLRVLDMPKYRENAAEKGVAWTCRVLCIKPRRKWHFGFGKSADDTGDASWTSRVKTNEGNVAGPFRAKSFRRGDGAFNFTEQGYP